MKFEMTIRQRPAAAAARSMHIAEVAALAGVSIATVSRALANPDRVNAKTRAHVLEVVRRTGYTPNVAGRSLRAARSRMVLVVVPTFITPFFSDLLLGVDRALTEPRLRPADRQPARRRRQGGGAGRPGPRRSGRRGAPAQRPHPARRRGIAGRCRRPDGGGQRAARPRPTCRRSWSQEREGAAAVARHLLELGHRQLRLRHRARGQLHRGRALGRLPRDAGGGRHRRRRRSSAIPAISTSRSGLAAGETFLRARRRRPTAVFAVSDMMAIGFMRARARGRPARSRATCRSRASTASSSPTTASRR